MELDQYNDSDKRLRKCYYEDEKWRKGYLDIPRQYLHFADDGHLIKSRKVEFEKEDGSEGQIIEDPVVPPVKQAKTVGRAGNRN